MITEQDLLSAIAECQGERDPNANTCIKLAAYYTIYNQLYGKSEQVQKMQQFNSSQYMPMYSTMPPEPIGHTIQYNSDTEFSRTVEGKDINDIMPVFDELMSALWASYPRLYNRVMQRLSE